MFDATQMIFKNGKMVKILSTNEICEMIRNKIEDYEERLNSVYEENKKLKDEHYKDGEIAKAKAAYEELRKESSLGFPMTIDENDRINGWRAAHELKCKLGHGAIGGKYTYKFIPTSIGTIGEFCCECGDSYCFRDL